MFVIRKNNGDEISREKSILDALEICSKKYGNNLGANELEKNKIWWIYNKLTDQLLCEIRKEE